MESVAKWRYKLPLSYISFLNYKKNYFYPNIHRNMLFFLSCLGLVHHELLTLGVPLLKKIEKQTKTKSSDTKSSTWY